MASRRKTSGLSFITGVWKPVGMTSHDVVNRVRRALSEKRVGHAGTLDPLAEGVLCVLVGPATRLDSYLTDHDKAYIASVSFGRSTTTDDAEGETLRTASIPQRLYDEAFVEETVDSLVGFHMQVPPAYSAIKVNGVKSYEAARRGRIINISPREIEIKQAKLIGITGDAIDEECIWNIELNVSKGTYIRSIARDLGVSLGVPAHLSALKRIRSGAITSDVCASIEAIERDGASCALDPVKTLGLRSVFVPEDLYKALENGAPISATDLEIYSCKQGYDDTCACSGSFSECKDGFRANEKICMLLPGELKAIYVFDAETNRLLPECVFQIGVKRGSIN